MDNSREERKLKAINEAIAKAKIVAEKSYWPDLIIKSAQEMAENPCKNCAVYEYVGPDDCAIHGILPYDDKCILVEESISDNDQIKWCVVKTAFHGGGILSKHKTFKEALKAANKFRGSDCDCGCCGIIRIEDINKLQWSDEVIEPRALAR